MNAKTGTYVGLVFLAVSHIMLAFGHDFLMAQKPVDFAHWFMLLGALLLFSLWFTMPNSATKKIGLALMSLGIVGIAGMCMIDFLLWSMGNDSESKSSLFQYISNTPSIQIPFMILGPALFYTGMCIATYALFFKYKWQVIMLNIGAMLIGLDHMILHKGLYAAIGGILLLVGLGAVVKQGADVDG